jgi:NDP-sugar pyrophosphorylase family protein
MNRTFTALGPEVGRAEVLDLMRARTFQQVPIIDGEGRLVGLHLMRELMGAGERPNWAVIMAGGKGTRLYPITANLPKPMIRVAGRSILERLVLHLVGFGIRRFFISIGDQGHLIEAHFGDGSRWGMRFSYSVEAEPRGTAGAVLDLAPPGDLLVVYGDLYVAMDCRKLLDFHAARPGAATLVVCRTDHPRDSDLVDLDGERVKRFYRARDAEPCGDLALAAVWVLRPELLKAVPRKGPSDFGRDIFPRALAAGMRLNGYVTGETVVDVGTPERRDRFLKNYPPQQRAA